MERKQCWGCSLMVEPLPSMHKALFWIPNTAKEQKQTDYSLMKDTYIFSKKKKR
jgi:hypothetical protein